MPMKKITDHIGSAANNVLTITAMDEPGPGGAHHHYDIGTFTSKHPSDSGDLPIVGHMLLFQKGTVPEVGVNGITEEALLAILIDRLRGFQSGPYSCRENAVALTHI